MSEHLKLYFPPRIILEGEEEKELTLYFKKKCNECGSNDIAITFSFLNEKDMKELIEKENKK